MPRHRRLARGLGGRVAASHGAASRIVASHDGASRIVAWRGPRTPACRAASLAEPDFVTLVSWAGASVTKTLMGTGFVTLETVAESRVTLSA
jgi:hypothetical protein